MMLYVYVYIYIYTRVGCACKGGALSETCCTKPRVCHGRCLINSPASKGSSKIGPSQNWQMYVVKKKTVYMPQYVQVYMDIYHIYIYVCVCVSICSLIDYVYESSIYMECKYHHRILFRNRRQNGNHQGTRKNSSHTTS